MVEVNRIRYSARVGVAALPYLSGVTMGEFYTDFARCAECYRTGRIKSKEVFGNSLVHPKVQCPSISYGHICCLGGKLEYTSNGEPGVRPFVSSIKEGIELLKQDIEFGNNEVFKFQYKFYEYLKSVFSEENVMFSGFGHEGPVTTAVLMRGQGFYMDIYDYPEETKKFLELLTGNIVKFVKFNRKLRGQEGVTPGGHLADDFASLISPALWDEYVLPYWDLMYTGISSGTRGLHCENLSPDHLPYLKKAGIGHYDPSVSAKLSPKIIKAVLDCSFTWRLLSFHVNDMTEDDVRSWVRKSFDEGAPHLHTIVESIMCQRNNPDKVLAFVDEAGKY
ncbi:MAG: uroporphyrinogen decarboxylase family protein [Elusimicrobiota bacterium]